MKCRVCGSILEDNANACSVCGYRIKKYCEECGALLLDGAKYCINCGKEVSIFDNNQSEPDITKSGLSSHSFTQTQFDKRKAEEKDNKTIKANYHSYGFTTSSNVTEKNIDETNNTKKGSFVHSLISNKKEQLRNARNEKKELKKYLKKQRKELLNRRTDEKVICDVCGREYTRRKMREGVACDFCYGFAERQGMFFDRLKTGKSFSRANWMTAADIKALKEIVESNEQIQSELEITNRSNCNYILADNNREMFYLNIPGNQNNIVYRFDQIKSFYPVLKHSEVVKEKIFYDPEFDDLKTKDILVDGHIEIELDDYYVKYLIIHPPLGRLPHFGRQKKIMSALRPYLDFLSWMTNKNPGEILNDA